MNGHVFIAPGDITRLGADAIAFSSSNALSRDGNLASSFEAAFPAFADWLRGLRASEPLPIAIGRTFWLPLEADRQPHGIVLVVSTGRHPEPDKAGRAVRSAIGRAAAELRRDRPTDRLLVALPAFRVGKGGDQSKRMASARAQVQAAVATLSAVSGVDVAFITYTPALYRIFLQARRDVLGPPPGPTYPALEQALASRACVLFVGAGLSAGAGLPGWNELIARLSRDLQVEPSSRIDHLDLAQWYREQFGGDRLADVLRSTFSGGGLPTLAHYLLMGLPVRHVITTNYDGLLEQALDALKRHPVPVIRQEEVADTGGAGVYVVKLHGDARHPDDVVLTRDDYAAFFERRPAMALLLEGLLLNQTFFFVGYSLRDPNFRQVFSRIARLLRESRRPAFATSFEAGGDTGEYLRRQWHRQQLELIAVPGDSLDEQVRSFLGFLDALADRVTLRSAPLTLAADVALSSPLGPMRRLLVGVGEEVVRLANGLAAPADLAFVADALDFLTDHGWRPTPTRDTPSLAHLFERLAGLATEEALRRRLLVAALGAAEAFTDVRRLREALTASFLAEGEKGSPSSPPENGPLHPV